VTFVDTSLCSSVHLATVPGDLSDSQPQHLAVGGRKGGSLSRDQPPPFRAKGERVSDAEMLAGAGMRVLARALLGVGALGIDDFPVGVFAQDLAVPELE
jgi:hypothetical protein